MNLLTLLAQARPDAINHLPDRTAVPLVDALRVFDDVGRDEVRNVAAAFDQELPALRQVLDGLDRLPARVRTAVEGSYLLRLPASTWAEWTDRATGWGTPARWVHYVEASDRATAGIVSPHDRDPELRISAFQDEEYRLVPLDLHLTAARPAITSVTFTTMTGCDMNDEGTCDHTHVPCSKSCGLILVYEEAGSAMSCQCPMF
jgi:hypothetical protein